MKSKVDRRIFLQTSALAGAATLAASKSEYAKGDPNFKVPIPDEPVTKEDYQALKKMAEEVYSGNAATLNGYTYHMPSKGSYPSLFAWDSGWNAMGVNQIDPKIAASEVELLAMQQMPDGRIPHEVVFKEVKVKKNLKTLMGTIVSRDQYQTVNGNLVSVQMDPPSYMVAAEKIFARTGDKAWAARLLPRYEKCIEFMTVKRDLFKDGLICIVHPWESGTDSSPAYDKILHISFKTPLGAQYRMLLYPEMFTRFKEMDYDINKIAQANRFILEDLTVISIAMRAILSVANMNEALGNLDKAKSYRAQAQKMMDAIDAELWDESKGYYNMRYDLKNPKFTDRLTCAALLPLWTGLVKKDRAERIIHEHVLNPKQFWLPYVFSFNANDEMQHDKFYGEDVLLWRGHCIWTNMNIMIMEALLTYGFKKEAAELTRRSAKMIRNQGFREFYDYRNGQGRRAFTFGWPGVVLNMIKQTWPDATV